MRYVLVLCIALGLESSGLRNVYAMVASALVTLARENETSVSVQKQILTSFGLAEDDALASALLEALGKVIPSVQLVLEQSSTCPCCVHLIVLLYGHSLADWYPRL